MLGVPTGGGAWAPTIRHHEGTFYLVVTDALGRGTLIFTAEKPEGPWSDGIVTDIDGIDPDLAWTADGTCYMTFSGLILSGEEMGKHLGIQQVRIDLATGKKLEEPRNMWKGTGLMFPEAPHLYEIDGTWYLMIAEGGTERGHGISIARSASPEGPFEGAPNNPILSARSTSRPVQNTGHGDLVRTRRRLGRSLPGHENSRYDPCFFFSRTRNFCQQCDLDRRLAACGTNRVERRFACPDFHR
jgi:beta-xylosidase